jgi:hypothetical protein
LQVDGGGVVEDDHELVSTETRDVTEISDHVIESSTDGREQYVAGRVPESVIDRLEPIDVEIENREVVASIVEASRQSFDETETIEKPTERIVANRVLESVVVVTHRIDDAGRVAEATSEKLTADGQEGREGDESEHHVRVSAARGPDLRISGIADGG